jgi:thiamine-monophosphate kinase
MAVNISDIASKGGMPRYCLVTLGVGSEVEPSFLRGVYDGMYAAAREWGFGIVGGDTVGLPDPGALLIDVFMAGEVPAGRAMLRTGAKPGDVIAVTGEFGLARAGLALLEEAGPVLAALGDPCREAIDRQLGAPVRLREAAAVLETRLVRCMSDTSDGLANQVHHICRRSGVGAVVEAAAVPVGGAVGVVAERFGVEPLAWALWGGEDYELMLTVQQSDFAKLQAAVASAGGAQLTAVGRITAEREVNISLPDGRVQPMAFGGWEHFRAADGGRATSGAGF